jgi:hypothetical protein
VLEWAVVAVHVINDGMASIQVKAVVFEVAGKDARIPADEGPSLHHLLPGFHSESWAISATWLARAGELDAGDAARVRAWVTLGNGVQKHSKWLSHTVEDV